MRRARGFDATAQRVYEVLGLRETFGDSRDDTLWSSGCLRESLSIRAAASERLVTRIAVVQSGDRHSRIPQSLNPGYRAVCETMTVLNHTMTSHAPVRLSEFRMAIRQILDCDADPLGVVELHVSRRNGEEWNGTVHVFEIAGHPRASRCYAWPEPLNETSVIIRVVAHAGRITSPERAVRSILNRRVRK